MRSLACTQSKWLGSRNARDSARLLQHTESTYYQLLWQAFQFCIHGYGVIILFGCLSLLSDFQGIVFVQAFAPLPRCERRLFKLGRDVQALYHRILEQEKRACSLCVFPRVNLVYGHDAGRKPCFDHTNDFVCPLLQGLHCNQAHSLLLIQPHCLAFSDQASAHCLPPL